MPVKKDTGNNGYTTESGVRSLADWAVGVADDEQSTASEGSLRKLESSSTAAAAPKMDSSPRPLPTVLLLSTPAFLYSAPG